jgi:hypothetical protein
MHSTIKTQQEAYSDTLATATRNMTDTAWGICTDHVMYCVTIVGSWNHTPDTHPDAQPFGLDNVTNT